MMHQTDIVGHAIRFHREVAGLSRAALSELAGVGTTAIYDIEHGKETVRLNTLIRLFDVLNIDLKLDSPLMDRFEAQQKKTEST